jgi:NAD(P)-dependent dehydrogenase (short-subunit alcohol dehydrogenase family)
MYYDQPRDEPDQPVTAVVVGGSGGLGKLIMLELFEHGIVAIDWSRESGVDVTDYSLIKAGQHLIWPTVDILINCAGVNVLNWMENLHPDDWEITFDVNVKSIWQTTALLLPKLRGGTIVNVSSNAAKVPMRCSLAYNASKAAVSMMTKQMARELGPRHDITVFGIAPNRLKGTPMSNMVSNQVQILRGWTEQQEHDYQLASIPAGEETPPALVAEFLCFLLSSKERHRYLQGCEIPYGGP